MKKYITSLCCFIAFISMGMTANNPSDSRPNFNCDGRRC